MGAGRRPMCSTTLDVPLKECLLTSPAETVDLAILGAGSGGYAAALRAAELGMSVVMVERDKVGGTCLHRGCIPPRRCCTRPRSPTTPRKGPEKFGVKSTFDGIDMDGLNAYKDGVVSKLYKGLTGLVKSRKIEVVEGSGPAGEPHQPAGRRPHDRGPPRIARHRLGVQVHCRASASTASASSPATTR